MASNFHTHTYRCRHAFGTEEDYVISAINCGLDQLGFSDHGPFPDHDFGLRMDYNELTDYLDTIDRLKIKYRDRIELFKGLEIEYYPEYTDYYRYLIGERKLDYLALGEHTYHSRSGEIKNIFFANSTGDFLEYAENLCMGMETGLFRFAAHPDIMFINDLPIDGNAEKACRMIVECAAKNNIILEYNANGHRRERRMYPDGMRYPYPHSFFWSMAARADIKVIVGSDCHTPDQVSDRYVKSAREAVIQLGLKLTDSIFDNTSKENQ